MSHSKGVLSAGQQLSYLCEWFSEFSEMQRNDFMKQLLTHYCVNKRTDDALINGISELTAADRPPSIFQCRLKLYNEWFIQWSDEEKHELLTRLRNIDEPFMDLFQSKIDANLNGDDYSDSADDHNDVLPLEPNGECNVIDEHKSIVNEQKRVEQLIDSDVCQTDERLDNGVDNDVDNGVEDGVDDESKNETELQSIDEDNDLVAVKPIEVEVQ